MNTKINFFCAFNFLNIGAIYGYWNGAIKLICENGYIVCLVEAK